MRHKCVGFLPVVLLALAAGCGERETLDLSEYEEGYVGVEGNLRLYYRSYGSGSHTLVLLHGGPGMNFMGVGPDLLPLARTHRLLMYDQRGGGRSDPDPQAKDQTVSTHVNDLETVRQYFGLETMTLIGHSWGSGLAAFYAAKHPERVERMILIGSMEPTSFLSEQRDAVMAEKYPAQEEEIDRLSQQLELAEDPLALCRAMFAIRQRPYYHDPTKMTQKLGDYCDVPADALARQEVIDEATWNSLGEYDLRPLLTRLQMPVLVIEGAQTPLALDAHREWAASLANARLWLINEVGHAYPFVEAPEVFFPGVERFLRGGWPEDAVSVQQH